MYLDFVYKQLSDGHKACKTTLFFTQYQRQRLIGLTSILYLSLQNYSTVTIVKTNIYDVNTEWAADTYTKFLLWYYLRARIMLSAILFLSDLDIHWAETRNKMIIWNHSPSGDNIKSKFVSVVISQRKWKYVFLSVYYKTSLPLYHHHTVQSTKRSNKDSKFTSNFTDTYSSIIYTPHV